MSLLKFYKKTQTVQLNEVTLDQREKDINATMRSLVKKFGCLDAVGELLNQTNKGIISKKMSGNLKWSIIDVVLLQDALGEYPLTKYLVKRMSEDEHLCNKDLITHISNVSKECGEAVSFALNASQKLTTDDIAIAKVEITEAIEALQNLYKKLG